MKNVVFISWYKPTTGNSCRELKKNDIDNVE